MEGGLYIRIEEKWKREGGGRQRTKCCWRGNVIRRRDWCLLSIELLLCTSPSLEKMYFCLSVCFSISCSCCLFFFDYWLPSFIILDRKVGWTRKNIQADTWRRRRRRRGRHSVNSFLLSTFRDNNKTQENTSTQETRLFINQQNFLCLCVVLLRNYLFFHCIYSVVHDVTLEYPSSLFLLSCGSSLVVIISCRDQLPFLRI